MNKAHKRSFRFYSFEELTKEVLYSILQLRSAVFVVEQNCPYQDMDDLDQQATHLAIFDGKTLIAYARILPPNTAYEGHSSIGRILTKKSHRATGLGRELVKKSIEFCLHNYPRFPVKIMAQCYLINFYRSFDFAVSGEEFLEDGIPHIEMVLDF